MNKKCSNLIKMSIVFIIAIILIFSIIVSQDQNHLETCCDDHCVYCSVIQMAQNIINLSSAVVIAIVIGILIFLFLSRLHKDKDVFMLVSLVFQKVQLNE